MPNFWDLPRPVRDKIYRMHLVFPDALDMAMHNAMCSFESGNDMPSLLRISDRAHDEAAPIYYGENHFTFGNLYIGGITSFTAQRHLLLIRKVTCDWNPEEDGAHYSFEQLARLKNIQELNIKVDERKMVHAGLCKRDLRVRRLKEKDEYSAQEQLAIYRYPGMAGLLSLRGIPTVNFLARRDSQDNEIGGTIPGGVLLTQVLPKITAPDPEVKGKGKVKGRGKAKAKAGKAATKGKAKTQRLQKGKPITFDLFGLPSELRNWIYELHLCIGGPIHPSKKAPSTAGKAGKKLKPEVPQSALCLLAVNKQIRNEAIGIYSSTPMLFHYPTQFHAFYLDMTPLRLKVMKDITIHYDNTKRGGIDLVDLTFPLLRNMNGLRRLHIILQGTLTRKICIRQWSSANYQMRDANPGLVPGLRVLFTLRGLTDIKVRDIALEEQHEKLQKDKAYPTFDTKSRSYHVVKLTAALEHFNAALLLAQTGLVSAELLEDNQWHTQDVFPELPEEESEDEAEDSDEDAEGDEASKSRQAEQQASEARDVPAAEVAVKPTSAAVATTETRRSARISDRLAKAQLVVEYNESDEDDVEQEQEEHEEEEEEDDMGEAIVVYRGRAASIEL